MWVRPRKMNEMWVQPWAMSEMWVRTRQSMLSCLPAGFRCRSPVGTGEAKPCNIRTLFEKDNIRMLHFKIYKKRKLSFLWNTQKMPENQGKLEPSKKQKVAQSGIARDLQTEQTNILKPSSEKPDLSLCASLTDLGDGWFLPVVKGYPEKAPLDANSC